jgi:hypothetical protein
MRIKVVLRKRMNACSAPQERSPQKLRDSEAMTPHPVIVKAFQASSLMITRSIRCQHSYERKIRSSFDCTKNEIS